jgi:excinuclease UvrABC helicase subunit UvrB
MELSDAQIILMVKNMAEEMRVTVRNANIRQQLADKFLREYQRLSDELNKVIEEQRKSDKEKNWTKSDRLQKNRDKIYEERNKLERERNKIDSLEEDEWNFLK